MAQPTTHGVSINAYNPSRTRPKSTSPPSNHIIYCFPQSWMVNFRDPAVVARHGRILVMLWHTVYGLYLWEFFTTLDYEWMVFRGHIRYRWTIWVYSVSRVAGLMGAILTFVGLNVTTQINCQIWFSFVVFFSYLSLATASLLIVLRIIAIWSRNKIAMLSTIGTWGINVAFLVQGVVRLRATWVPEGLTCAVANPVDNAPSLYSLAVTDIVLLLIMLAGLLRLRYRGGSTFGLTNLLWKQGLAWTLIAAAAEVPPAVMIALNLNDPLNNMLQAPAVITMTIAATRMHRSLVEFAPRSSDVVRNNIQTSDLEFARPKPTHSTTVPPNPMGVAVRTVFEQYLDLTPDDG